LSRICKDEPAELEVGPIIDLESEAFFDSDYRDLKEKFTLQQSKFPDVKVSNQFIYMKTEHATGIEEQDKSLWKLWVPTRLRIDVLQQSSFYIVECRRLSRNCAEICIGLGCQMMFVITFVTAILVKRVNHRTISFDLQWASNLPHVDRFKGYMLIY